MSPDAATRREKENDAIIERAERDLTPLTHEFVMDRQIDLSELSKRGWQADYYLKRHCPPGWLPEKK